VGALTSTDFRFKMRVWFLKETPSICTESSVGVNTTVWSREGKIYRITPRRNDEVNDSWMSDSGRELYKLVEAENRLTKGTADSQEALYRALRDARGLAVVASGRMSLEEQFLLSKLAKALRAVRVDLVSHVEKGDGLLISADRTPNVRGALLTGLIEGYPSAKLDGLKEEIASGRVKTILTIREDLMAAGLTAEELKGITILQMESRSNATTPLASVVQPVPTVFERSGSFVNQQLRVQKFTQAIPAPEGVPTDIALLDKCLARLGEAPLPAPTPEAVWKLMAATIPQLKGLTYSTLPSTGVALDASAFEAIAFPEGKSLHYAPTAVKV